MPKTPPKKAWTQRTPQPCLRNQKHDKIMPKIHMRNLVKKNSMHRSCMPKTPNTTVGSYQKKV